MSDNPRAPSTAATITQLVLWSIVVGVVLSALGITPFNLFDRLGLILRNIYDLGFGAVQSALQYLLLGAIIVVPIWLIARMMRGQRS